MRNLPAEQSLFPAEPPAPSGGRQWTAEQLRGITTTGRSLLVSAAAGSGKTAVLSERCVYLVCDARQACDIDELLVVTFTEAAAMEMKSRIAGALRQRAARAPSARLARQVALAEQANVSTLHSFCTRLLRQHFHLARLDPSFRVLDGDEAYLLRREIARELLRDRYELDDGGEFHRLIDGYGDGDDRKILKQLLHAHDLLTSVLDPAAWLTNARARIADGATGQLEQSELGHQLVALLEKGLDSLTHRCELARAQVSELGFSKYAHYLGNLAGAIRYWSQALRDGGVDALCEVVKDMQPDDLPREKGDAADLELAKSAINSVREQMKKGAWRNLLRFTSAQWQEGLSATQPHAEIFLSLVEQFQTRYRMAKSASRAVDFADLERLTLMVLRDADAQGLFPSAAALACHRRFAHVLVDEYQDINEVQDAILYLLSRECIAAQGKVIGNLFCVGDVKQSIYRFRLAEPGRFLARQDRFREPGAIGEAIDLQHNFRSRGPLLEAINSVFEGLMTADAAEIEYKKGHRLQAGLTYPPAPGMQCFSGSPIELHLLAARSREGNDEAEESETEDLDRSEREALLIARRIRQVLGLDGQTPTCVMARGKDGLEPRPARFSDIVVLLRSMKHKAQRYAAVLRDSGIPVHFDSGSGYFESAEVADMLALLELLNNRRQDIPLAAVLRSPVANVQQPEEAMARIRAAYPAGDGIAFHEAVFRYAAEHDDVIAKNVRQFLDQLDRWRNASRQRPLAEVIWRIYRETGYLAFVSGLVGGEQRIANLMHLHERAAQFSRFQRQGLSRFMRFLRELEEESDAALPSIASEAQDVVRIMSVHRSKGLEFPIVIVADLGKRINLADCQGNILVDRAAGLGMSVVDEHKQCRYPSLALALVKQRLSRAAIAEELRVLYVAMTRAREHLILLGTCREGSADKWALRWAGHQGPLPADVVQEARTALDWLGPVAFATVDTFITTTYSEMDMKAWPLPAARQRGQNSGPALARLQPLADDPPVTEAAARAIARVWFQYPHRPAAELPAAQAMTEAPGTKLQTLHRPTFMLEAQNSANSYRAIDRGEATHLVLQHLQFGGDCDGDDVSAQIQWLVLRRIITGAQASLVDRDAIAWLLQSPVGQLLRLHHRILRRELPIYLAKDAMPDSDPLDRIMLRGRLDVLIPLSDGCILIDYKTDAILPDDAPARAAAYGPQMQAYRDAVEKLAECPVTKSYLVFLGPRVIFPL
jgi:ATP-dependent helicase/nuclease subunit A